MAKQSLTERQDEALEFIRAFIREHRKPPTMKEIGAALGMRSTNGVYKLLNALQKKGHLVRQAGQARGLQLVDGEDAFALDEGPPTLMVVSRTNSAQPERLRRRPSGWLTVDPFFFGTGDTQADEDTCLVARAGDDGMNDEGIRKGDLLVVEEVEWPDLRRGETVAVLVGDKLLVRRFEFANGRLHLRAHARGYNDDTYSPDDVGCFVVGRVLGVMRKLV